MSIWGRAYKGGKEGLDRTTVVFTFWVREGNGACLDLDDFGQAPECGTGEMK